MGIGSPKKEQSEARGQGRGPVLRALFDLSFSRFLSLELVGLVYIAAIMAAIVAVIASIFIAFSNGIWVGVGSILIAPILFLLYVISWRIWLELLIVLFRIAEYGREIAENTSILGRRETPPDAPRR
jgi:hypothetical protein